ncbi:hypothetical protein F5148DRAFT_104000 [Russula earlei]|uniref:Uncharacterized protein n=1 Tax=Russula earlei TaxID=71964 RepID=A0ACC0U8X2_9AGAM|nr:hypothetical protein F5148DRAFT_104000 [Russula earlei]
MLGQSSSLSHGPVLSSPSSTLFLSSILCHLAQSRPLPSMMPQPYHTQGPSNHYGLSWRWWYQQPSRRQLQAISSPPSLVSSTSSSSRLS